MALAHCILGKFLGVVCYCFPPNSVCLKKMQSHVYCSRMPVDGEMPSNKPPVPTSFGLHTIYVSMFTQILRHAAAKFNSLLFLWTPPTPNINIFTAGSLTISYFRSKFNDGKGAAFPFHNIRLHWNLNLPSQLSTVLHQTCGSLIRVQGTYHHNSEVRHPRCVLNYRKG